MAEEKMYVSPFDTVRLTSEDVNVGNYVVYAAYDEDEDEHRLYIDEDCTKPAEIPDVVHAAKRGSILVYIVDRWYSPSILVSDDYYEDDYSEWIDILTIVMPGSHPISEGSYVMIAYPISLYAYNPNYDPDAEGPAPA